MARNWDPWLDTTFREDDPDGQAAAELAEESVQRNS